MTAPFGPGLEEKLKQTKQGGRLYSCKDFVVDPQFFCCVSGTPVGVLKKPVPVLLVTPRRVCTGNPVNADFSHSWAPSSTIVSWSVAWGDDQVSNGVWPGPPWNVNHPLGGYAWPGIYNITLTITDNVAPPATGVTRVQVEVLDCTGIPDVEAFCGCGSSGVWYTNTGGRAWANWGGGVLDSTPILDLSSSPYSFGMPIHRVWAATQDGLYLTEDVIPAWKQIENFPAGMTPRAVKASPYSKDEVYVLADDDTGAAFLLRSEDDGKTWTQLRISQIYRDYLAFTGFADDFLYGQKMDAPQGAGASIVTCAFPDDLRWRNPATGDYQQLQTDDLEGNLSIFTALGAPTAYLLTGQEGAGYNRLAIWYDYDNLTAGHKFVQSAYWAVAQHILLKQHEVWLLDSTAGWHHAGTSPWEIPGTAVARSMLPISATEALIMRDHQILRCTIVAGNATFTEEWANPDVTLHAPLVGLSATNFYCVAANGPRLLVRNNATQTWVWDGPACPSNITAVGDTTAGGPVTLYVVAEGGIYARNALGTQYTFVADIKNAERLFYNDGGAGMVFVMTSGDNYPGIYRIGAETYRLPTGFLHHCIDINTTGEFIYVSLIEIATGNPVTLRISYDLELVDVLYEPGAGTWGGVIADKIEVGRLWAFGDFGAATKVLVSDDFGDTWTNITDGIPSAGGEVVAAVLPSLWRADDAVTILNIASESYITRDATQWTKTGDLNFNVASAARDLFNPATIFVGRSNVGGPPLLQFSPNEGATWLERSAGLPSDAIITAIEVVG